MMLKAVVAALLLSGLSAVPAVAGDMHSIADRYIQSDAKIRDRDLAIAILCLVAGLPEQATAAAPLDDVEAAGKIQLLAGKIIQNGSPDIAALPPDPTEMTDAKIDAKPIFVLSENSKYGTEIVCEVDKLMKTMKSGSASTMEPDKCPDAVGTKDAIIQLAYKIIGNG